MKPTGIKDAQSLLVRWRRTQELLLDQYKTAGYECCGLIARCLHNLADNAPAYKGKQYLGLKPEFPWLLNARPAFPPLPVVDDNSPEAFESFSDEIDKYLEGK